MKVRKLLAGLLASAMIVSSLGANTTVFASEIVIPKEAVEECINFMKVLLILTTLKSHL